MLCSYSLFIVLIMKIQSVVLSALVMLLTASVAQARVSSVVSADQVVECTPKK